MKGCVKEPFFQSASVTYILPRSTRLCVDVVKGIVILYNKRYGLPLVLSRKHFCLCVNAGIIRDLIYGSILGESEMCFVVLRISRPCLCLVLTVVGVVQC